MNLTAITQPDQVATLHLLDCAALLPLSPLAGKTVIDVGTGAGLPGMVLALLTPDARFTLLDSLGKRIDFCKRSAMTWACPTSPASTPGRRTSPRSTGSGTMWPCPVPWPS